MGLEENKEEHFYLDAGNLPVEFKFIYPKTKKKFGDYLINNPAEVKRNEPHIISISPEYIRQNRWLVDENETSQPFKEFQALMLATGNYLLSYRRALFHGAAFIWRNLAWIFTAPSGTGKTTQLNNWNQLCGRSVQIINGDKPLLECRDDGSVWVHSSPWRGKEKIGSPGLSARLGGIILLEKGENNKIIALNPEDAVRPLFVEFISYPENTDQILQQAELLEHILKAVPIWKLVNVGDMASSEMTQRALLDHLSSLGDSIAATTIATQETQEGPHE